MKKEVQIEGNYGGYMLLLSVLLLIQVLSTGFIDNFELLFYIVLGFTLIEGIAILKPRIAKIVVLSLIASAMVWIVLNSISIWLMEEFGSFIIYGTIFTILAIPLFVSNYYKIKQHWIILTIMFAMLFFDSMYLVILMPFMYLYSHHKIRN